ncbi:MAG: hypothetical protein HY039_11225 [Nitrospirae bacterium]|nr:hypothetical protein [Nitrospirota bacterium]
MASSWSKFQEYVWKNWWLRQFSPSRGWDSEYQKPLLDGAIILDFAAWSGNERAVGDAKDKATLTADDVEKLLEDGGAFKATHLFLIIAADTEVPDSVREYAEDNGVEIVRTQWRA